MSKGHHRCALCSCRFPPREAPFEILSLKFDSMINDGIVIKTTEEFGRAAYVIRHFRAGEVVLNERM